MNKFILLTFFLTCNLIFSQHEKCNINKSEAIDILKIDISNMVCISKNSTKPYTVFYTFASWCAPCREHISNLNELQKKFENKIDSFVLIVEGEKDRGVRSGIDFIRDKNPNAKILILKDDVFGENVRKKNNKFIAEISKKKKRFNPGYSVFILMNNQGEVLRVTDNYEDYRKKSDGTWEDTDEVLNRVIIPLIK